MKNLNDLIIESSDDELLSIIDEKLDKSDIERFEIIKNLTQKAKDRLHKVITKQWMDNLTDLKNIMSNK